MMVNQECFWILIKIGMFGVYIYYYYIYIIILGSYNDISYGIGHGNPGICKSYFQTWEVMENVCFFSNYYISNLKNQQKTEEPKLPLQKSLFTIQLHLFHLCTHKWSSQKGCNVQYVNVVYFVWGHYNISTFHINNSEVNPEKLRLCVPNVILVIIAFYYYLYILGMGRYIII